MSGSLPSGPAQDGVQFVTDRRLVLLGGGLLLGFAIVSTKPWARGERVNPRGPQPVSSKKPSQAFGAAFSGQNPEALIHIPPQGPITLIMPNAECGQGIYMGEATLIAEELEVGLDQIQVAAAPPNEDLYKQPLLQLQATGGSTSIRGAWTPFRQAGAMARILLVQAAAQAWGVPESECVARRAVITHAASGRSAPYGTFAEAASRLPKPTHVALKPPSQFELIGKRLQRVDTPAKVVGEAKYGIDIIVPGMKVATVAASPILGGRLASVDDTAALAIAGVRQVVQLPNAVAVVGDHFWAAKTGLEALKITWAPGANATLSTADLWASMDRSARQGPAAVANAPRSASPRSTDSPSSATRRWSPRRRWSTFAAAAQRSGAAPRSPPAPSPSWRRSSVARSSR
jgi:isoquinoline 1-oxidoreductase beta subunit